MEWLALVILACLVLELRAAASIGIVLALCLGFLSLVATLSPAWAWLPHGTVGAACPFATDNGCAAAPAGGQFINSNFFSSGEGNARQTLQTYSSTGQSGSTSAHPPPLNVAGVDYAVGPTIAEASATDVATWTPGAGGCTYSATGAPGGFPALTCTGSTVDVEGYNFGPNGSHDCVSLYVNATVTSLTLKNNWWRAGKTSAGSLGSCASATYLLPTMVYVNEVTGSTVIESNYFNGEMAFACCTPSDLHGIRIALAEGPTTVKYNAFLEMSAGAFYVTDDGGAAGANPVTAQYNYMVNMEPRSDGSHGEVFGVSQENDGTTGALTEQGNTIALGSRSASAFTAIFYGDTTCGGCTGTGTRNGLLIDSNTEVMNLVGAAAYTTTPIPLRTQTATLAFDGAGNVTVSSLSGGGLAAVGESSAAAGIIFYQDEGGGVYKYDCSAVGTACSATSFGPGVSPFSGTLTSQTLTAIQADRPFVFSHVDYGTATAGSIAITNNYADWTGANGLGDYLVLFETSTCNSTPTVSGNYTMTTGATWNAIGVSSAPGC